MMFGRERSRIRLKSGDVRENDTRDVDLITRFKKEHSSRVLIILIVIATTIARTNTNKPWRQRLRFRYADIEGVSYRSSREKNKDT